MVANGRRMAPRLIPEILYSRLGNERLVPPTENGEPSLRGISVRESAKPVGGVFVPDTSSPEVADRDESKSCCRLVRGAMVASSDLVELKSALGRSRLESLLFPVGSVQKSEPRLGRLDLLSSNSDCLDLRFWVLPRLWFSFAGEPRLRRGPTVRFCRCDSKSNPSVSANVLDELGP